MIIGKKVTSARKISYLIHKGKIPKGKALVNTCETKGCVNPDHIIPKDNRREDPKDRFMRKVRLLDSGCWEWIGGRKEVGYGSFMLIPTRGVRGRFVGAHVASHVLFVGPVPKGMCVCHKCDYTHCVNPDHLFIGTRKENLKDAMEKGRMAHGENSGTSKFKTKTILKIRDLFDSGKYNKAQLARKFNMSRRNVRAIVNRETWKHV